MTDEPEDLQRTLIDGLDRILFELGQIDAALLNAPRAHDLGIIQETRRRTASLSDQANTFLTWVTDTRLEPPVN